MRCTYNKKKIFKYIVSVHFGYDYFTLPVVVLHFFKSINKNV